MARLGGGSSAKSTRFARRRSAMGMLDRFEQKLDRMVNGAFAKAFKSDLHPVEIAAALQRELDDRAAVVSRSRTVVPNIFVVELSPTDFERLTIYDGAVAQELAVLVREYAQEQRYTFLGAVEVSLASQPDMGTGMFRIRSEGRQGRDVTPAGAPASDGQPHLEVDGIRYPLHAVTRLGRGTETDIRVDDPGVSRQHAEIVLGTDVIIRDLGSTNGTIVDGRPVTSQVLRDGAQIRLGTTTLIYRAR
jgi:hypothetical protein